MQEFIDSAKASIEEMKEVMSEKNADKVNNNAFYNQAKEFIGKINKNIIDESKRAATSAESEMKNGYTDEQIEKEVNSSLTNSDAELEKIKNLKIKILNRNNYKEPYTNNVCGSLCVNKSLLLL